MPFSPPLPVRERILDLGPAGSGKTSNFLHIARHLTLTQTGSNFYVGDSDFSMERMLAGYPELLPHISVNPLYDWGDYLRFEKFAVTNAGPNDWICVDFVGSAWKAVQEEYAQRAFNKDMGDYFLALKKGEIKEDSGWGQSKWDVINPWYSSWIMSLLFKSRAHLFCTAKSESLSDAKKPTEAKEIRAMFLPFSCKPVGQKDLPFQFHTVLVSDRDVQGRRLINTVKDRERLEVRGQVVTNFAVDYLTNIAGWTVTA